MTAATAGLQLSIFDVMRIEPTISMRQGKAFLTQCGSCGTLIAAPGKPPAVTLGPCPVCWGTTWWTQHTHTVGPFRTGPA